MIITKTPLRISLFGGGTDYPSWLEHHNGRVVGGAINQYCYILAKPINGLFPYKMRLVYKTIEHVNKHEDINHKVIRTVLESMQLSDIEIAHISDMPGSSGLGSSSAFVVGLLNALHTLQNDPRPQSSLAKEAVFVEQVRLNETVGCQDQHFAAIGGLRVFEFGKQTKTYELPYNKFSIERLEAHMLLVFTDHLRIASDVAGSYAKKMTDYPDVMNRLYDGVDDMIDAIRLEKFEVIGSLLSEAWEIKKNFSPKVSSASINAMYNSVMSEGAYGGKLLGAGGGGMFLFIAPPEKHEAILNNLGLRGMHVRFDHDGTTKIS